MIEYFSLSTKLVFILRAKDSFKLLEPGMKIITENLYYNVKISEEFLHFLIEYAKNYSPNLINSCLNSIGLCFHEGTAYGMFK